MLDLSTTLTAQLIGGKLPYSEDAERAVLGTGLLNSAWLDIAAPLLEVEHFFDPRHRLIWAVMKSLHSAGQPADSLTVGSRLEMNGELSRAGGLAYVVTLDTYLPDPDRVETYAAIVKDRWLRRRLIEVALEQIRVSTDPGREADALVTVCQTALANLDATGSKSYVAASEVAEQLGGVLSEGRTSSVGLPTGFSDLDRFTYGFQPGQLWQVAARPGHGKTTWAMNTMQHLSCAGYKVALASLEMTSREILVRMVCSASGIDAHRLRQGRITPEERERARDYIAGLKEEPLFLDDTPFLGVSEILARARRLKATRGLDVLYIDHVQLIRGGKAESRNYDLEETSRRLKAAAKDLMVTVVCLSQLSRAIDNRADHTPMLSDLRDSGSLEADADVVLFLYRPELYRPKEPELKGQAEAIIGKNRDGMTGALTWHFDGARYQFRTLDRR